MKKNHMLLAVLSMSMIAGLAACAGQVTETATFVNANASSPYGSIHDFNLDATKEYKVGDVLTFKVTPNEDFYIDTVTANGNVLKETSYDDATNTASYSWILAKGENRISAAYTVDTSVDFVSEFNLDITDEMFAELEAAPSTATDNWYDFRKDGIERAKSESEGGFVNYVDGDTTHVETYNYGYTVKLRYLGIDTPESTSELEEWGKAASLYNKHCLEKATQIILQSQGWARGDEDKSSTTDGNGRNLAYVWYATTKNPTLSDFRCLNLEMVYAGYSQGIGALDDLGEKYYLAFTKAGMSAKANKRGQFAGTKDPYYDYEAPEELTLKQIYQSGSADNKIDSKWLFSEAKTKADQKPWRFIKTTGYVSRKINGAMYIQDKPSYEQTGTEKVEAYGMYVFTYAQTDIMVGDEISVIGVLSTYGGCYQIQGIEYSAFNIDPDRNTTILSTGHEIVPVKMSSAEFDASSSYNDVLVEFTDDLYCYNKVSTYDGSDAAEGGTEEVNKYNEKYPFYNTSNKLIFFAKIGSPTGTSEMRITQDENIRVSYKLETSRSYKFYVGGTVNYNPKGAEYVYPTVQEDESLITTTYKAKHMKLTAICQNYLSSSGKTQNYQLVISSAADVKIIDEIA